MAKLLDSHEVSCKEEFLKKDVLNKKQLNKFTVRIYVISFTYACAFLFVRDEIYARYRIDEEEWCK